MDIERTLASLVLGKKVIWAEDSSTSNTLSWSCGCIVAMHPNSIASGTLNGTQDPLSQSHSLCLALESTDPASSHRGITWLLLSNSSIKHVYIQIGLGRINRQEETCSPVIWYYRPLLSSSSTLLPIEYLGCPLSLPPPMIDSSCVSGLNLESATQLLDENGRKEILDWFDRESFLNCLLTGDVPLAEYAVKIFSTDYGIWWKGIVRQHDRDSRELIIQDPYQQYLRVNPKFVLVRLICTPTGSSRSLSMLQRSSSSSLEPAPSITQSTAPTTSSITPPSLPKPLSDRPNDPRSKHKIQANQPEFSDNDFAVLKGIVQSITNPPAEPQPHLSPVSDPIPPPPSLPPPVPLLPPDKLTPKETLPPQQEPHPPVSNEHCKQHVIAKNVYMSGSPISSDEECTSINQENFPEKRSQETQPIRHKREQTSRRDSGRSEGEKHSHSKRSYSRGDRDRRYIQSEREAQTYRDERRDYRYDRIRGAHSDPRMRQTGFYEKRDPTRREEKLCSPPQPPFSNPGTLSPTHMLPTDPPPPGILPMMPTHPPFMPHPSLLPLPNFIPPSNPSYSAERPQIYPPAYSPPYPRMPPDLSQVKGTFPSQPPMLYPTPPPPPPHSQTLPSWDRPPSPYPLHPYSSHPPRNERGRHISRNSSSTVIKREHNIHGITGYKRARPDAFSNLTLLTPTPPPILVPEPYEREGTEEHRDREMSSPSKEVDLLPPVCSPISGPIHESVSESEQEGKGAAPADRRDSPAQPISSPTSPISDFKSPISEADADESRLEIVLLREESILQNTETKDDSLDADIFPQPTATPLTEDVELEKEEGDDLVTEMVVASISQQDDTGVASCEEIQNTSPQEKYEIKPSDALHLSKLPANTSQLVHKHSEPRLLISPIHNSVLQTSFRAENKSPVFSPPHSHRPTPLQLPMRYSAAISSDDSLKFSVPFPLPKTPEESPQSDKSMAKSPSPSTTLSPTNTHPPATNSQTETETKTSKSKQKRGKRKSGTPVKTRTKRPTVELRLGDEEGPSFVQDDACLFYYGPIPKCLECKKHQHHSSMSYLTQMVNERRAACAFIGFRKLSDLNKTQCHVTGFITDKEADSYDLSLWRYSPAYDTMKTLPPKAAVYLITSLQHYFCSSMFPDVELHHPPSQSVAKLSQVSNLGRSAWKKHVYQARELCDVCETTIFSSHFLCASCSYTVCTKCFELKSELPETEQDMCKEFMWRYCQKKRRKHKPSDLMVAEIIPYDIVTETHQEMHSVMKKLDIDKPCIIYDKLPLPPPALKVCPDAIPLTVPTPFPVLAPYTYLCDGQILNLLDAKHEANIRQFRQYWNRGEPLVISNCHRDLDPMLWQPESFAQDFGDDIVRPVDCLTRNSISAMKLRIFWEGFTDISQRVKLYSQTPLILKLKDWPPDHDFMDKMPERYKDYTENLPMSEYTTREGIFNLASRLPPEFSKPDLGPKMYIAYGSAGVKDMATTALHIDISDAMNLMICVSRTMTSVSSPQLDEIIAGENAVISQLIANSSIEVQERAKNPKNIPGALWHIFSADDSPKIRQFILKYYEEISKQVKETSDPIHDQSIYLDHKLRERLADEHGVVGWEIIQFVGDSIFIPAGAPHQVKNLYNCIKVAEDFVSPENVSHCINLTEEFRHLSKFHTNHEDKLQIKNIIYHSVKDATGTLKKVLETYT